MRSAENTNAQSKAIDIPLQRFIAQTSWLHWHATHIDGIASMHSAETQLKRVQAAWDGLVQHMSFELEKNERQ